MADEYLVNIVLKARDEGMAAFAEMGTALAALVAEAKLVSEELKRLNETATEHGNALHNMSLDTRRAADEAAHMADTLASKLTPAFNNVNRASGGNGGAASGLMQFVQGAIPGGQTAGNITIAITLAALAFAPFTAELAASLILLGAWVVGATAFIAVVGIAAAGVLALAGGIAFLGLQQMGGINPAAALTKAQAQLTTATNQASAAQEAVNVAALRYNTSPTAMNALHLQQAQEALTEAQQKQVAAQNAVNVATINANGPMATLRQSISDMATTLGQAAVPMTTQMLNALIPLVPQVQAAGQALIDWFGPRLPAVLVITQQAFGNLLVGLQRVAEGWGQLIDHVLARSPEFGNIINGAFNRAIDGVLGLLINLTRLSDWFVARLPVLGANANSTFGNLGIVIQALGSGLGRFVDWVIVAWPTINRAFDSAWEHFQAGYKLIKPLLDNFHQDMLELQPLFIFIERHADNLAPLMAALGLAVGLVVAALGALLVIGVLIVALIVGIATVIAALATQIQSQMPSMGAQFSALGTAAQTMGRDIGGVFSAIGTWLHQVGLNIQTMVREGGAQFSALGTAAQTMQRDIGSAFSAIGSAANSMAGAVGKAFSGLGTDVQKGLKAVGQVFDAFGTAVNGALGVFGVHVNAVHYATGGVVPGYAPGQDSVLAMLSPGEGVLTPQTVRAMGGEGAIKALNQAGPSLENQMGANTTPGSWGGQCVTFAEALLGTYWPVAFASQLTRYINSQTARTGEAAVFTGGPFGHVAVVTGAGDGYSFPVIDSNWVANETIGMHTMNKSMYGFAGFIDMGKTLGTMAGLGIPGLTSPAGLLDGLVTRALGGLGGWEGALAKGILGQAVKGITHSLGFDSGGGLPPGGTYAWNGTGRTETVTPASTMDKVEGLLREAVQELRQMNGKPKLSAATAGMRF